MTHYYDEEQRSTNNERDILVELDIDTFSVTTDNGVFAKDGLDSGTELLINTVTPKESFLDLGCGYGVVSVAYLRRRPRLDAVLVDTNKRALRLANENLRRHGLDADVKQSDAYNAVERRFTDIITNPPLAAGKATCHAFIDDAPGHLEDGGRLSLVAPHNKGGRGLKERMRDVFGNVDEQAKSGGFRVYQSHT